MKKIFLVCILSLIIFGFISTLMFENTWAGFRYRLILGIANGFIPFLAGTAIYHFALNFFVKRVSILKAFFPQLCFGIAISLPLLIVIQEWFILGVGVIISSIYYFVAKFLVKKSG